jgi:hypothetical protein
LVFRKDRINSFAQKSIEELKSKGFTVNAIVCDGRKGLIQACDHISVQMRQFHQAAIIRRYLTHKTKLPAAIELKAIKSLLKQTDKEYFTGLLNDWQLKWNLFLKERTVNTETVKSHYTHKRLRSAYRSLKNNLP